MFHHESAAYKMNNNNYDNRNNANSHFSSESTNTFTVCCRMKKIETYISIDYSAEQKGKM